MSAPTQPTRVPPQVTGWMLPSAAALGYATAALMPALLLTLACKIDQAAKLAARAQTALALGDAAVLLPDGAAVLGAAWVAAWLLDKLHGPARRWGIGLLHVLGAVLMAAAVIDQAFFLTTGAALDGDLLGYGLRNFAMLQRVIGSELTVPRLAALLGLPALTLLPRWLPTLRAWRQDTVDPSTPAHRPLRGAVLTTALLGALALLAWSPDRWPRPWPRTRPQAGLRLLDRSLQWSWLASACRPAPEEPALGPTEQGERLQLGAQDPRKHWNLLVVVLESSRAQSTTLAQPGLATTPFLAQLAARGASADQAYTLVPHTTKALIPIFCGVPPRLAPEFDEADWGGLLGPCLPGLLRERGYATAFVTPASGDFEYNRRLAAQMGFDQIIAGEDFKQPKLAQVVAGKAQVNYFGYEDAVIPEAVLAWTARQQGPFAVGVLTLNAHHPYEQPEGRPGSGLGTGVLGDYLGALRSTDDVLRTLVDGLQRQGHGQDTLIAVVGDHGEAFGEHGLYQHDEVPYDEALRVPLVVTGPGVTPGLRVAGPRQNLDLMPTLLELLGLPVTSGKLAGTSLWQATGQPRLRMAAWPRNRALMLREGRWKLIDHLGRRDPEVYDLDTDPEEQADLFALGKADRRWVSEASADLHQWRDATNRAYAQRGRERWAGVVSPAPPAGLQRKLVVFSAGVRLVAWGRGLALPDGGKGPALTLVWQAERPVAPAWQVRARLVGPGGQLVSLAPLAGSRPVPPWGWPVGSYINQRWGIPGVDSAAGPGWHLEVAAEDEAGSLDRAGWVRAGEW